MNKTYCDICGSESEHRDNWLLNISPHGIMMTKNKDYSSINVGDVCPTCAKLIIDLVRKRKARI